MNGFSVLLMLGDGFRIFEILPFQDFYRRRDRAVSCLFSCKIS